MLGGEWGGARALGYGGSKDQYPTNEWDFPTMKK
jgi:hypothetical protein